jgi:2-hydroxy-3-keto-5-methylthiopentenyl-1-phosphate phosphatase
MNGVTHHRNGLGQERSRNRKTASRLAHRRRPRTIISIDGIRPILPPEPPITQTVLSEGESQSIVVSIGENKSSLEKVKETASDTSSQEAGFASTTTSARRTDFSSVESAVSLVSSAAIDPDTKKQQAAKKDKLSLLQDAQYIAEPGVFDVLLGRGKPIQDNPGNKILRQIVDFHSRSYLYAARKDKKVIVQEIVLATKANGNRFLRQNDETECWEEVDNEVAKQNVCHCFHSQAARRVRSSSSSLKPSFSSNSSAPAAAGFSQTYTAAAMSGSPPIVQFPLHAMEQHKSSHAPTMTSTITSITSSPSALLLEAKSEDESRNQQGVSVVTSSIHYSSPSLSPSHCEDDHQPLRVDDDDEESFGDLQERLDRYFRAQEKEEQDSAAASAGNNMVMEAGAQEMVTEEGHDSTAASAGNNMVVKTEAQEIVTEEKLDSAMSGGPIVQFSLHAMEQQKSSHVPTMTSTITSIASPPPSALLLEAKNEDESRNQQGVSVVTSSIHYSSPSLSPSHCEDDHQPLRVDDDDKESFGDLQERLDRYFRGQEEGEQDSTAASAGNNMVMEAGAQEIVTKEEQDSRAASAGNNMVVKAEAQEIVTEEELDAMAASAGNDMVVKAEAQEIVTEEEQDSTAASAGNNMVMEAGAQEIVTEEGQDSTAASAGNDMVVKTEAQEIVTEEEQDSIAASAGNNMVVMEAEIVTKEEHDSTAASAGNNMVVKAEAQEIVTEEELDAIAASAGSDMVVKTEAQEIVTEEEQDSTAASAGNNMVVEAEEAHEIVMKDEHDSTAASVGNNMVVKAEAQEIATEEEHNGTASSAGKYMVMEAVAQDIALNKPVSNISQRIPKLLDGQTRNLHIAFVSFVETDLGGIDTSKLIQGREVNPRRRNGIHHPLNLRPEPPAPAESACMMTKKRDDGCSKKVDMGLVSKRARTAHFATNPVPVYKENLEPAKSQNNQNNLKSLALIPKKQKLRFGLIGATKSVRFTNIFHTRYFQKDTPVSEWNVESRHHNTDEENEAPETSFSPGSRAEPLGDAIQNGTCKELIQVLNDPDIPKGGLRNQYDIVKKELASVRREIDGNSSDFVVYGRKRDLVAKREALNIYINSSYWIDKAITLQHWTHFELRVRHMQLLNTSNVSVERRSNKQVRGKVRTRVNGVFYDLVSRVARS